MLEILTREEYFENMSEPYDYLEFPEIPIIHSDIEILDKKENRYYEISNNFKYFRYNDPDVLMTDEGIKFISVASAKNRTFFNSLNFPIYLRDNLQGFWEYLRSELIKTGGGINLYKDFLDTITIKKLDSVSDYYTNYQIPGHAYSFLKLDNEIIDKGDESISIWWELQKNDKKYIINQIYHSWLNKLYVFDMPDKDSRKIIEELFVLKLWI